MSDPGMDGRRGLDEFERIRQHLAPLAEGLHGAGNLQDDVAYLAPSPGKAFAVTADALVESVHFLADDMPCDIACKALRVNISDLAAKGAVPTAYLLTLALPERLDDGWFASFCEGLAQDQSLFGVRLAGGDSVTTPGPLMISITAFGEVDPGVSPTRSGARPGDDIYVSGTIGDGFLGLMAARHRLSLEGSDFLARRYRLPEPRLALGQAVAPMVSAMMDISDGLIGDLMHIAAASGVGAAVEGPLIPVSEPAIGWLVEAPDGIVDLVTGGDDYELLFTASPDNREALKEGAERSDTPIRRIGRVTERDTGVMLLNANGDPVPFDTPGYRHR